MAKYRVYSKWKSGKDWQVERTYLLKEVAEDVAKVLKDTDVKSKLKRFREDNNNFTSRFTNENKTLLSNYRKKLRR